MVERILVPLDGSPLAERILDFVQRIFRHEEVELSLLHAFGVPPVQVDYAALAARNRQEGENYLRSMEEKAKSLGMKAKRILDESHPAHAILEHAARERAGWIAMSTHGRTGLSRFVLGSIAEKVLRASSVPLLLLRSFSNGAESAPRETAVRKALVPLDGSENSLRVLRPLKVLLRHQDARAELLHVQPPAPEPGHWPPSDVPLQQAERELAQAGIPSEYHLRVGDPASEILAEAAARAVDLIAMTTHGRSGVSRWVLGSVTEKVVRAADAPLLVVRTAAPGSAG
ncbi:MAG: universal stress protein [Planctomycetes bacterium]|nr:universal stress protein [Planctomycetota bacterium]